MANNEPKLGTLAQYGRYNELHARLLNDKEKKINLNESDYPGMNMTPLDWAAFNNHVDIIKLLLENGADISHSNALNWAASNGNIASITALVKAGATPTDDSCKKATDIDVLKALLPNDSDAELFEKIIFNFARTRDYNCLKSVLIKGIDINTKNRDGYSMLDFGR